MSYPTCPVCGYPVLPGEPASYRRVFGPDGLLVSATLVACDYCARLGTLERLEAQAEREGLEVVGARDTDGRWVPLGGAAAGGAFDRQQRAGIDSPRVRLGYRPGRPELVKEATLGQLLPALMPTGW